MAAERGAHLLQRALLVADRPRRDVVQPSEVAPPHARVERAVPVDEHLRQPLELGAGPGERLRHDALGGGRVLVRVRVRVRVRGRVRGRVRVRARARANPNPNLDLPATFRAGLGFAQP